MQFNTYIFVLLAVLVVEVFCNAGSIDGEENKSSSRGLEIRGLEREKRSPVPIIDGLNFNVGFGVKPATQNRPVNNFGTSSLFNILNPTNTAAGNNNPILGFGTGMKPSNNILGFGRQQSNTVTPNRGQLGSGNQWTANTVTPNRGQPGAGSQWTTNTLTQPGNYVTTGNRENTVSQSNGLFGRTQGMTSAPIAENRIEVEYTTAKPIGISTENSNGGCIVPEQPRGGSFELNQCEKPCHIRAGTKVPTGSFLTYRCDDGYVLKGNNISFCYENTWYMPPNCEKICPPLKSNSVDIVCKYRGDIVSCSNNVAPETKATLACKHSYKLLPSYDPVYREITCLETGDWDRPLFNCLPECGTAVAHGNTLIVGGFNAKLGVFPWHVGVYQKNSSGLFTQICAGSLISPNLVVSAAHCFYDDTITRVNDPSNYAIAAGKYYRSYYKRESSVQKSAVKKIDLAGRYYGMSGNFAEDIALVRLETPFTLTSLIRPICMDWDNSYEREQLQSGKVGKVVGWGKTASGLPSEELQEINLPYIPYQECASAVPDEFKPYITADKFCAGYLNGSSLCDGDSGGGLSFQLDGLWYLRGIVSVSPVAENMCDYNYYVAFTNVGRFSEWIRTAFLLN